MLAENHLSELILLRHELHKHPELSGEEVKTASTISNYLEQYNPDQIIDGLGIHGVAAIYQGKTQGPTTMIRCELDALPIQETNNDIGYKSVNNGVSHKCGHDGHMAMVAGLARLLSKNPPNTGKVVLLFQPAEETGQGAKWVLGDSKFDDIKPDYCFALHNLPGYPLAEVLIKEGTFCAASKGIKIQLEGLTSHASEPEKGVSPAMAIAKLIPDLLAIPEKQKHAFKDFVLITLTHTQIGEKTFGISPAKGEIFLTIRAYLNDDLNSLTTVIHDMIKKDSKGLKVHFSEHEAFAATMNHRDEIALINEVANANQLDVTQMNVPNRWSEDFGLFLRQSKGAMFGFGSGMNQPALHNPDYDFPDEIIESGVKMFWTIIQRLNY